MLSYFNSITVPGLEHITVFRDDEDATQFYAMPSTPRLARDNQGRLLLDLPFSLELAKDGTAEMIFEPVEPQEGDWWNAVLVDLLDKTMVDDARTLLARANELAGSGELTWDLTVVSPIFAAAARPERWANLVAVEVEISAPGFDTMTVA